MGGEDRTGHNTDKCINSHLDPVRTGGCKKIENFVILFLQPCLHLVMFSTASLNFGSSSENFGGWKKSFTLEMASC